MSWASLDLIAPLLSFSARSPGPGAEPGGKMSSPGCRRRNYTCLLTGVSGAADSQLSPCLSPVKDNSSNFSYKVTPTWTINMKSSVFSQGAFALPELLQEEGLRFNVQPRTMDALMVLPCRKYYVLMILDTAAWGGFNLKSAVVWASKSSQVSICEEKNKIGERQRQRQKMIILAKQR